MWQPWQRHFLQKVVHIWGASLTFFLPSKDWNQGLKGREKGKKGEKRFGNHIKRYIYDYLWMSHFYTCNPGGHLSPVSADRVKLPSFSGIFSLSICLISVSENSIIRQRNGQASSSPDVMGKRENWTDGHRGTASKFMQLTTGGALLILSAQIIKANSS